MLFEDRYLKNKTAKELIYAEYIAQPRQVGELKINLLIKTEPNKEINYFKFLLQPLPMIVL